MTHTSAVLKFSEGGIIQEVCARIAQLKKVNSREVLFTDCGKTIDLNDLLSVDGVSWSI
jgi:hypothetical protein